MMKKFLFVLLLGGTLMTASAEDIPFVLKNNTSKSIYLLIPGVMNPNLSPFSGSGVSLEEGQKIFFVHKGQEYILLEVDESLRNKKLSVHKLIKQRKTQLGLK